MLYFVLKAWKNLDLAVFFWVEQLHNRQVVSNSKRAICNLCLFTLC